MADRITNPIRATFVDAYIAEGSSLLVIEDPGDSTGVYRYINAGDPDADYDHEFSGTTDQRERFVVDRCTVAGLKALAADNNVCFRMAEAAHTGNGRIADALLALPGDE